MNQQTDNAPDTLLEQIKSMPKVTADDPFPFTQELTLQMADRIIADAERIEWLEEHLREIMNVSGTSTLHWKIAQDALKGENKQ